MDLFYTAKNPQGSLKKISDEIKKTYGEKLNICNGSIGNIGNNILFVLEHVTVHGFLKNPREKNDLIDQLNERGISKYFITYSYLVPSSKVTRDQIKSSSGWIHSIIDVINPRAIVLLGDMCCHTFFTRKEQAVKRHGEIIGKHNEIPVLLSFNLDYYFEHTKTEDVKYKEFIREHDWEKIKELYDLQVAT